MPNIEHLDSDRPFSITVWVYHPKEDGGFTVASQADPEDKWRGWSLHISRHIAMFKMVSDDGESIRLGPDHLQQMEGGTWNHVAVSYDGSGETAGLNYYLNGKLILTRGSEYFAKLEGNIRTQPADPVGEARQPGE